MSMACVAAPATTTWAQDESQEESVLDPDYQVALKRGNKAYNDGDYDAAVQSYTQAIQAAPLQPDPYRNMARAFFWKGDYNASLAYYDLYLVTFPDAKDVDQIRRERRLTSERTSTPWKLPETQRKAIDDIIAASRREFADIQAKAASAASGAQHRVVVAVESESGGKW